MKIVKLGAKNKNDCARTLQEFLQMAEDGKLKSIGIVALDENGYILYNYHIESGTSEPSSLMVGTELLKDRIKKEVFG